MPPSAFRTDVQQLEVVFYFFFFGLLLLLNGAIWLRLQPMHRCPVGGHFGPIQTRL